MTTKPETKIKLSGNMRVIPLKESDRMTTKATPPLEYILTDHTDNTGYTVELFDEKLHGDIIEFMPTNVIHVIQVTPEIKRAVNCHDELIKRVELFNEELKTKNAEFVALVGKDSDYCQLEIKRNEELLKRARGDNHG